MRHNITLLVIGIIMISYQNSYSQVQFETINQVEQCIKGKWEIQNSQNKSVWYIYFDKSQEVINGGRLFYKIDYGKNNEILNEFRGVWTPSDDVPKIKLKTFDNYYYWDIKLSNCNRFINNGVGIFIKTSNEDFVNREMLKLKLKNNIQQIISNYSCVTCHKLDGKNLGPSYTEIGKKYNKENIPYLINRIKNGGGNNVWGKLPKMSSPYVKQEEMKQLLEYIFELNKIN
jgi:cytochrome c551/c552